MSLLSPFVTRTTLTVMWHCITSSWVILTYYLIPFVQVNDCNVITYCTPCSCFMFDCYSKITSVYIVIAFVLHPLDTLHSTLYSLGLYSTALYPEFPILANLHPVHVCFVTAFNTNSPSQPAYSTSNNPSKCLLHCANCI